jgi:glucosamine kinase
MTEYFLGVDGGGSKTLALIVDEQGQECGRGVSGSSNHYAIGLSQALENLHAAVNLAVAMAGCALPVCAAWLGMAGVDRPGDYEMLLPHLNKLAETVRVTNDVELVLSALDDMTGVALIAGTGSIALGRDSRGETWRVGGWGHVLGDEGSGFDMGRQVLQAVLRAADGRGPATQLSTLVMQDWHLNHHSDILEPAYSEDGTSKIARLAPLVLRAARDGDVVAQGIVEQASAELALAAFAARKNLSFPADAPVALVFGGGLLLNVETFREAVLRAWRRYQPEGPIVFAEQPALSAARAAVRLRNAEIEIER